jgi:hypothetical protein
MSESRFWKKIEVMLINDKEENFKINFYAKYRKEWKFLHKTTHFFCKKTPKTKINSDILQVCPRDFFCKSCLESRKNTHFANFRPMVPFCHFFCCFPMEWPQSELKVTVKSITDIDNARFHHPLLHPLSISGRSRLFF